MPVQHPPLKAAISSTEMAELCQLSRSRFYSLVESGAFPKAIESKASKRPFYDHDLQQKCLDIRRTGIGFDGQPILFNRKLKKDRVNKVADKSEHAGLLEALAELGVKTTPQAVTEVLQKLFPTGVDGVDPGQVIKKLFQELNRKDRQ